MRFIRSDTSKKAKVNSRTKDSMWVWQVIQWTSRSKLGLLFETRTGTRTVKEANHIRLHPDNINKDNGIEIPEAWTSTFKQHNTNSVPLWTTEEQNSSLNDKDGIPSINSNPSEDRNAPIINQVLLILTPSQPIPSPNEDQQYSGRNVAIHDPIVTQKTQLSSRNHNEQHHFSTMLC